MAIFDPPVLYQTTHIQTSLMDDPIFSVAFLPWPSRNQSLQGMFQNLNCRRCLTKRWGNDRWTRNCTETGGQSEKIQALFYWKFSTLHLWCYEKRNSKKTGLITWKMQSRNMANVGEWSFDFDATESLKGPLVVRDQKGWPACNHSRSIRASKPLPKHQKWFKNGFPFKLAQV